jgi:hypothetical protein
LISVDSVEQPQAHSLIFPIENPPFKPLSNKALIRESNGIFQAIHEDPSTSVRSHYLLLASEENGLELIVLVDK